jgi:hypothetical protein
MTLKSKLLDVLEKKRPQKMPMAQLLAFLKGQGVKDTELAFIGKLDPAQFMVGNSVDPAALWKAYEFAENEDGIGFYFLSESGWKLPSYVTKAPKGPQYSSNNLHMEGGQNYFELVACMAWAVPKQHGSHFGEYPNVVGWLRGQIIKNYLFVDEIQTGDYYKSHYIKGEQKAEPDKPFVDYSDLVRLLLKAAVEIGLANNLTGVAWINGAQQAARNHSLLTMVGEITVKKKAKGYTIVHGQGRTDVPDGKALADHIGGPQAEAAVKALHQPAAPLPKGLKVSQTGPVLITKPKLAKLRKHYDAAVEAFNKAVPGFKPDDPKWAPLIAEDEKVSAFVLQEPRVVELPPLLFDRWLRLMGVVLAKSTAGTAAVAGILKEVSEAARLWEVSEKGGRGTYRVLGTGLTKEAARKAARKALGLDPTAGITMRLDEPRFISNKAYLTMYDTVIPAVARKLINPYRGNVQVVMQTPLKESPTGTLPNLGFDFTPEMKKGVEFYLYNPRTTFKRLRKGASCALRHRLNRVP